VSVAAADSLETLEVALEQTGAVIRGIRPDQARLPTPCTEFDVRALVNHTTYDVQMFTTILNGGERPAPGADLIGEDWVGAFDSASAILLDAWRKRGVDGKLQTRMGDLPATWAAGQHTADMAVHAWDIAAATGQPTDLDPEIGQVALDWAKANLKPEFRGQAFGPEVEVSENAPLYDRLAAFFGRHPTVNQQ
jgi:uncharacterized protein (TIGR03086 family)